MQIELRLVFEGDYQIWLQHHKKLASPDAEYTDVEQIILQNSLPKYLSFNFDPDTTLKDAQNQMLQEVRPLLPEIPFWRRAVMFLFRLGEPKFKFESPSAPDAAYHVDRTLDELGFSSGDIIVMGYSYTRLPLGLATFWGDAISGNYELQQKGPIEFFDSIITDERYSFRIDRWDTKGTPRPSTAVGAIVLYTEEDLGIAQYVRQHYASLHVMSGLYLTLYFFEYMPPLKSEFRRGVRTFWAERLPDLWNNIWSAIGLTQSKPYPNEEIYYIADQISIPHDRIPCMVFFRKWKEIKEDRIILDITEPIPQFFRRTCTDVKRAIECMKGEQSTGTFLASFTLEKFRAQLPGWWSVSRVGTLQSEAGATGDGDAAMVSILFLGADPTDISRLRLGEELREIQEKLKLAKLRDRFDLQQQMSVRPADISQALLDVQPQIVHFAGHGTSAGALCFENQVGEMHPIEADALEALFKQFASRVECVVLNACYAETQAKAIARHIEYVIGMSNAISDRAAIAFAIGFYQALGAGRTIEDAYNLGVVQIRLQGIPEHLTPVLIKKCQAQL